MLRRLLPLLALGALAACAHPASGLTSRPARTPGTFRVLTLNTAHGTVQPLLGPLLPRAAVQRNLRAIAAVLAREEADVVALQEVHLATDGGGLDHAAVLAQASGYPHHFFGAHLAASGRWAAHGTALLSSVALVRPTSVAFGLHPGDDKGYVLATVAPPGLGGAQVDVVSLHLDPFSDAKRIRQMDALARALAGRGRPLVVMGDFNTGWGRPGGVQRLARRLGLRAHRPGTGERTFPVLLPIGRIDWVLVSRELRILGYRTFREPVTDHCGVVAELGWARAVRATKL